MMVCQPERTGEEAVMAYFYPAIHLEVLRKTIRKPIPGKI
jgi:hypothetical protein